MVEPKKQSTIEYYHFLTSYNSFFSFFSILRCLQVIAKFKARAKGEGEGLLSQVLSTVFAFHRYRSDKEMKN